jgi:hypothetical protein
MAIIYHACGRDLNALPSPAPHRHRRRRLASERTRRSTTQPTNSFIASLNDLTLHGHDATSSLHDSRNKHRSATKRRRDPDVIPGRHGVNVSKSLFRHREVTLDAAPTAPQPPRPPTRANNSAQDPSSTEAALRRHRQARSVLRAFSGK